MAWHARLDIDYAVTQQRTVARHVHDGPLRLLQSLYPEGDAICHNVLVHPPGGLVGGDTLDIHIQACGDAHALITTPGATRYYRSEGQPTVQHTHIRLRDRARLEWLPQESIAYDACIAENQLSVSLDPQAQIMAWDVTALGLAGAGLPFECGQFLQHLEVSGLWLERGLIQAQDHLLMQGPLGLASLRCMGSMLFASGSKLVRPQREAALELARALIDKHMLKSTAGVTCPNEQMVVLRVLAPMAEPVNDLLRQMWQGWRQHFWQRGTAMPRIWST